MKKTQRVPIPVLFYLFYLRLTGFEFLIFVVALLNKRAVNALFVESIAEIYNFCS